MYPVLANMISWLLSWLRPLTDEERAKAYFDIMRHRRRLKDFKPTLRKIMLEKPKPRCRPLSNRPVRVNEDISFVPLALAYQISMGAVMRGANRRFLDALVLIHFLGYAAALMDLSHQLAFMYVTAAGLDELDENGIYGELKMRVDILKPFAPVVVYNRKSYAIIQQGRPFALYPMSIDIFERAGLVLMDSVGHALPPYVLRDVHAHNMPPNALQYQY